MSTRSEVRLGAGEVESGEIYTTTASLFVDNSTLQPRSTLHGTSSVYSEPTPQAIADQARSRRKVAYPQSHVKAASTPAQGAGADGRTRYPMREDQQPLVEGREGVQRRVYGESGQPCVPAVTSRVPVDQQPTGSRPHSARSNASVEELSFDVELQRHQIEQQRYQITQQRQEMEQQRQQITELRKAVDLLLKLQLEAQKESTGDRPATPPVSRPVPPPVQPGQVPWDTSVAAVDAWLAKMGRGDIPKPVPEHYKVTRFGDERDIMSPLRFADLPEPSGFRPPVTSSRIRPVSGPLTPSPPVAESKTRAFFPEKYHGTTPLSEYLVHFELCAELNGWDATDKARYLAVSLRGQAQRLLGTLHWDTVRDYAALVGALQERFGIEGQQEIFLAELQAKMKEPKETYQELGDNVARLVSKAYPTATTDTLRVLTVQHFLRAITDRELRMHVKLRKPTSVRNAVLFAIEFEAIQKSDRQDTVRPQQVRQVQEEQGAMSDEEVVKPKKRSSKPTAKVQQVSTGPSSEEQMAKLIRDLEAKLAMKDQATKPRKPKVPLEQVRCYRCRQMGHYASRCEASIDEVKAQQENFRRRNKDSAQGNE